ncbi:MAG: tellurite resistance protein-like permease [Thermaceae bacterium]
MSLRFFNPGWFAATMGGAGFVLVLEGAGLEGPAHLVLGITALLFLLTLFLWGGKLLLYPQQVWQDYHHPMLSQLQATLPIALLLLGLSIKVVWGWGEVSLWLAGLGTVLTLLNSLLTALLVFIRLRLPFEEANGTWFIPPASALVVPLSLGWVLKGVAWAEAVYPFLWAFFGLGTVLFLWVGSTLFARLYSHDRPVLQLLPSLWILLAPVGVWILALEALLGLGEVLGVVSRPVGVVFLEAALWGLGAWWMLLALGVLLEEALNNKNPPAWLRLATLPGVWGLVFPLAAFTRATQVLARHLESPVFAMLAGGLALLLALFYLYALSGLLWAFLTREVFKPHPTPHSPVKAS